MTLFLCLYCIAAINRGLILFHGSVSDPLPDLSEGDGTSPPNYTDDAFTFNYKTPVGMTPHLTQLDSPHGPPMEESISFAVVVWRKVLKRQLLSIETKTNVLAEILQSGPALYEPLLPFNDTLTDTLMATSLKPCTCLPENRQVIRR